MFLFYLCILFIIFRLCHARNQRQHVILADEMGLGKTIQCIAFLAALTCAPLLCSGGDSERASEQTFMFLGLWLLCAGVIEGRLRKALNKGLANICVNIHPFKLLIRFLPDIQYKPKWAS